MRSRIKMKGVHYIGKGQLIAYHFGSQLRPVGRAYNYHRIRIIRPYICAYYIIRIRFYRGPVDSVWLIAYLINYIILVRMGLGLMLPEYPRIRYTYIRVSRCKYMPVYYGIHSPGTYLIH